MYSFRTFSIRLIRLCVSPANVLLWTSPQVIWELFESWTTGVVHWFELDGDHDTNQLAEFSSHRQHWQGVCPRWTQAAGLCIIFSCAPTVPVGTKQFVKQPQILISRSSPAFKQQLDRWTDNCAQVLHVLRLSAARGWIRCLSGVPGFAWGVQHQWDDLFSSA